MDIRTVMDEELDKIDNSLNDLENNSQENIEKMINVVNNEVEKQQYKNNLIKLLTKYKELGHNIDIKENMSIEELENLLTQIKM